MHRITEKLILLLALLLPWHGAVTVFLSDLEWVRFWKEGVLGILLLIVFALEWQNLKQKKNLPQSPLLKGITNEEWWAVGFLAWMGVLVLFSPDSSTALVAARYLGMGFLVFLVGSRLLRHFSLSQKEALFEKFSLVFILSSLGSGLFGIWARFLGGFEVLRDFYSTTISSWVPGQTIPIYHQTDEFIRVQGASSGPTEFAHMLFAALFLLLLRKKDRATSKGLFLHVVVTFFLLFCIIQSFSRAAILVSLGVLLYVIGRKFFATKKIVVGGAVIGVLLGMGIFLSDNAIRTNFFTRAGTSEHITRPIEAFQMGLERPISGHLGEVGPAARAKNLREHNNDQAFIAENVFADYFVQLGIVGLVLALGFLVSLFRSVSPEYYPFLIATIVSANIATIFDMTPISILFFFVFAFFSKMSTMASEK